MCCEQCRRVRREAVTTAPEYDFPFIALLGVTMQAAVAVIRHKPNVSGGAFDNTDY